MLISKTVIIKWTKRMKKYYINKGYIFTKYGDEFEIKVEDLSEGSRVLIEIKCDNPNCENPHLKPVAYVDYLKCIAEDNKYYCFKCARKLHGGKKLIKTLLKNRKSFYAWCIENNREDILNRWDYELNKCSSKDITYSTNKKYYFKCPKNIHPSELKNINSFVKGQEGTMDCKMCNSFAQWGIDNICSDFLEKYWDYKKNNELDINPWEIPKSCSSPMVYIKCQEKYYHDSYISRCSTFMRGDRCPYCATFHGKVHPLDSLGKILEDKGLLWIWSNKNKKSPYEYTPFSMKKVWWKCLEGKHEDYYRDIHNSTTYNFRCPECNFSKGEKKIENYLKIKHINYIPQKEFDNLMGLGGKKLSYDFYLPQYNLLIEYQGEFHDGNGNYYMKKNLEKQQEHDRRKREYAKSHNVKLLEIWYYNYDNIEEILNKELKIDNDFKEVI
jgi:hypothetical protein